MADDDDNKKPVSPEKADKSARLSDALRANLQRRKTQTRGRKMTDTTPDSSPEDG